MANRKKTPILVNKNGSTDWEKISYELWEILEKVEYRNDLTNSRPYISALCKARKQYLIRDRAGVLVPRKSK